MYQRNIDLQQHVMELIRNLLADSKENCAKLVRQFRLSNDGSVLSYVFDADRADNIDNTHHTLILNVIQILAVHESAFLFKALHFN